LNPAVIAWVAVSAIGLVLTIVLANESRLDLHALPKKTNGRRIVARSRLARELLRLSVHGLFLLAGFMALDLIPGRGLIVPILLWGNLVLVINSIIDHHTRRVLYVTRDGEPDLPAPEDA
jgi:hypothetical protein